MNHLGPQNGDEVESGFADEDEHGFADENGGLLPPLNMPIPNIFVLNLIKFFGFFMLGLVSLNTALAAHELDTIIQYKANAATSFITSFAGLMFFLMAGILKFELDMKYHEQPLRRLAARTQISSQQQQLSDNNHFTNCMFLNRHWIIWVTLNVIATIVNVVFAYFTYSLYANMTTCVSGSTTSGDTNPYVSYGNSRYYETALTCAQDRPFIQSMNECNCISSTDTSNCITFSNTTDCQSLLDDVPMLCMKVYLWSIALVFGTIVVAILMIYAFYPVVCTSNSNSSISTVRQSQPFTHVTQLDDDEDDGL